MERYLMVLKSFKRMPLELEEILRNNFQCLPVTKHDVVQKPGATTDKLYFVEKGLFRIYYNHGTKRDTLRFKIEDEFIIGLQQCMPKEEDVDGIEALEDGILWHISGALVKELRTKFTEFEMQCCAVIMKDCIHMKHAARCYGSADSSRNFQMLCRHFPRLLRRVPVAYLSDYVRMPEEMFRHLSSKKISLNVSTKRRRRRHNQ